MLKIRQFFRHLGMIPSLLFTYFRIKRLGNSTRLFCFFPYYQTGGSERVHADILESIHTEKKRHEVAIFFTKVSWSSTFKNHFQTAGRCFEVAKLDRSKFRRFLIKTIARAINRADSPTVFGANATFMYELIPYLREWVRIVDLTHSFVPESDNPIERASLPYVGRLAARVVINGKTKQDYAKLYRAEGIPDEALSNVYIMHNKLSYPRWDLAQKEYAIPPLKVLFVGRNSPEKRIALIVHVARALREAPITFTLVGSGLKESIDRSGQTNLHFAGEINDPAALARIYQAHHVILITSRREGFPLVLAEGMAHGAVPVSTDVGGISYHVHDEKNGFLVENNDNETSIVEDIAARLQYLVNHSDVLPQLGKAAQTEAYASFDPEIFDRKWRELLIR